MLGTQLKLAPMSGKCWGWVRILPRLLPVVVLEWLLLLLAIPLLLVALQPAVPSLQFRLQGL